MENQYPSLVHRIQSLFIDLLFIIVLMFVFSSIFDHFGDPPDWVRVALFVGIWAIYEPLCVVFGCTLGQYIKGLRVKSHEDTNRRINIFSSYLRYVLKTLLGWVSFLTINTNAERRAIHDLASGSVMVLAAKKGSDPVEGK